jgi:hypothetical protein
MDFTINITKLKAFFLLLPYFAMIIVGLMMPSDGNHGIMTPKSISFLGSVTFFLIYVFTKKRFSFYQLKMLGSAVLLTSFLLIWLFLGLTLDDLSQAAPIDQFKIFIITISFVIMTLFVVDEGLVSPEALIKTMILTNFSYSFLKLMIIVLHLLKFINMFALMEAYDMRFMSMEMTTGIFRFQTSVDIVTPFFILFVLQADKLKLNFSSKFKYIFCIVSVISILFSFSRFLMGVALTSAILYWLTLSRKNVARGFAVCFILSFLFISFIGFDVFVSIIERRFFSNDNYYSDLTRTQQIAALLGQFFKAPFLGTGLGGFVKDFIRDGGIVHSYEVQWVAFLMQFGLFGMILLLIPVGYICSRFILKPLTRVKLSFLSLFLVWLLSGFTNPFLISLASGIVYAIFLLAATILNRKPVVTSPLLES